MNILILYGEMSKHEPSFNGIGGPLIHATSWHGMGLSPNIDYKPASEAVEALKLERDVIIVYNALDDYLANRFSVKGRPWVAALSFHFEDTYSFYSSTVPVHDMGIDAVFTNCKPLVERGAPFMPVKFMWPPTGYAARPQPALTTRVGAYISSVADRDFSLLERCFEIMSDAGHHDMRVYLHDSVDRNKLPNARFSEEATMETVNSMARMQMRAYVPTPRVSDILMGVVDDEMILALALGFWPVWVKHRKFEHMQSQIEPLVTSMRSLNDLVLKACDDSMRDMFGREEPLIKIGQPDQELVDAIKMAYRRKKGAST
jgi:hypothetical protein